MSTPKYRRTGQIYIQVVYGQKGAEMFANNGGWNSVQEMLEELDLDSVDYWWINFDEAGYKIPADAVKVVLKRPVINYIMGSVFDYPDIRGYQSPGEKDIAWVPDRLVE